MKQNIIVSQGKNGYAARAPKLKGRAVTKDSAEAAAHKLAKQLFGDQLRAVVSSHSFGNSESGLQIFTAHVTEHTERARA